MNVFFALKGTYFLFLFELLSFVNHKKSKCFVCEFIAKQSSFKFCVQNHGLFENLRVNVVNLF